mgnify:CR=1 FL=1
MPDVTKVASIIPAIEDIASEKAPTIRCTPTTKVAKSTACHALLPPAFPRVVAAAGKRSAGVEAVSAAFA